MAVGGGWKMFGNLNVVDILSKKIKQSLSYTRLRLRAGELSMALSPLSMVRHYRATIDGRRHLR